MLCNELSKRLQFFFKTWCESYSSKFQSRHYIDNFLKLIWLCLCTLIILPCCNYLVFSYYLLDYWLSSSLLFQEFFIRIAAFHILFWVYLSTSFITRITKQYHMNFVELFFKNALKVFVTKILWWAKKPPQMFSHTFHN